MKANELRIGNAVYDRDGVVRWINHRKISDIASNPNTHGYRPIPLTPEILEKAGFEKQEYPALLKYSMISYIVFIEWWYEKNIAELKDVDGNTLCDIKYLHQLQNIYFSLAGTELEINLNP